MPTIRLSMTEAREYILEQIDRLNTVTNEARQLAENPDATAKDLESVRTVLNSMAYAAAGAINHVEVQETRQ